MTQVLVNKLETDTDASGSYLTKISILDGELINHFKQSSRFEKAFTRQIVSFQANKTRSAYRWYKYKEAFSAELVEHILQENKIPKGKILDPFAGVGTTLFAASQAGYSTEGIELLPIGQEVIDARKCAGEMTPEGIEILKHWKNNRPWEKSDRSESINNLRITNGAYPHQTEVEIGKYLHQAKKERPPVSNLLRFALLCVLESVSFTRKDGQYLRWDSRSGRKNGHKPFDKGQIYTFREAIVKKLDEIIFDLANRKELHGLFERHKIPSKEIHLLKGSSLDILPTLKTGSYSAVITSPPYCNRYDYTRTYALELAMLGITESQLTQLRQNMLSSTVENRPKDLLKINPNWRGAVEVTDKQELLQAIIEYLEYQRREQKLNNPGIARMVKGYFYEMACIIFESRRVLRPNGLMFMVNDNVRYAGASVSVDLVLSSIAEGLGFVVDGILIVPQGKGNSSQQMGQYGRDALRKCVYVWRKSA
ncbi:MAG: DNA methyltransferase [Sedimentisphaerales bacterium]